jgi:hypothetical protein
MTERVLPLGRHVEHDPLSKLYRAARAPVLKTVKHARQAPVWDQGDLGDCTGNAMAGALMTDPLRQPSWSFDEKTARDLYSAATHLDGIAGVWPPTDTGSSGLAVAKAAKAAGYISAYHHAFGLQHALEALVLTPVIVGIDWLDTFDKPDRNGQVHVTSHSQVRGGHEIEAFGLDVDMKTVWFYNSWGPEWGLQGSFSLSWHDLDLLLQAQGDVTVAVR